MTYEPVKIANGTGLSKVLKEVQEVQHRESNDAKAEFQFCAGYVSLLKGRFANLSDTGVVANSSKKSASKKHSANIPTDNAAFPTVVTENVKGTSSSSNSINTMSDEQSLTAFRKSSADQASSYSTRQPAVTNGSSTSSGVNSVAPVSIVESVKQNVSSDVQSDESYANASSSQSLQVNHKADIQNLKRLFEQLANVTETSHVASDRKQEGKSTNASGAAARSSLASNRSPVLANRAQIDVSAYRTSSSLIAISNRTAASNRISLNSSLAPSSVSSPRPASWQPVPSNRSPVANARFYPTTASSPNPKLTVDAQSDLAPSVDKAHTPEHNGACASATQQTPASPVNQDHSWLDDPDAGKKVLVETATLVRIRKAGSSWYFGTNVKEADVPPGCIPFEVRALQKQKDTANRQRNAQFERLFALLPTANGTHGLSTTHLDLTDSASPTSSTPANRNANTANTPAAAQNSAATFIPAAQSRTRTPQVEPKLTESLSLTQLDTQLTHHLTSTQQSAPETRSGTESEKCNAPPSYGDVAANLNLSAVALAQSGSARPPDTNAKSSASTTPSASTSANANANANASASGAPQSAYALFSVLHSQTNKSEEDDDDFASTSDEERELKLREAARRIQVTGANVRSKKSALLSDKKRKSANSGSTMSDSGRTKDTLTISQGASADRSRRISFNDAAIVTHEYPSEQCWNEAADYEGESSEAGLAHEGADDEDVEESEGSLNSRFYALFAPNTKQNTQSAPTLPSYDESVKRNDVKPTRILFVDNDAQPTTIRLNDEDDEELESSDDVVTNQVGGAQRQRSATDMLSNSGAKEIGNDASYRSSSTHLLF